MATIAKNFKVKNGLVVDGTVATVNGSNVLTEASTTFLNNLISDQAGSLLANATLSNLTISYDASTNSLSIAAENGIADSSTDDLTEGVTNLYFTDERAQDAFGTLVANGTYTGATVTYDDATNALNISIADQFPSHTTDDLSEGATNLYFTDARALSATSAAYDPAGSAATAESNANSYTDGREIAITSAYQSYADTAEADANSYTDSLIGDVTVDGTGGNTVTDRIATAVSNLVDAAPGTLDTLNELAAALGDDPNFATSVATDIGTKVSKSGDSMTGDLTLAQDPTQNLHAATKQYVDTAESDAVATAAADATSKADAALASAQTYADQAEADAVATAAADATTKANTAESNANTYTDNQIAAIDTDGVSEGLTNQYFTDERAQDAVAAAIAAGTQTNITVTYDDVANSLSFEAENGVADSTTDDLTEGSTNLYFTDARAVAALEAVTPTFTEVDVNSIALQVASTVTIATQNTTGTVYSFDSGTYQSAKFLVKAATGTHSEITEVILTLDSSNNIAITEYAMVNTGGSLMDVTAVMNGTDVELQVTAVNDNTTVKASGTLLV